MIIPLGLGLLIYTAPGRRSSPDALQANRFARFIASPNFAAFTSYFMVVLIMTAALFATLSRGGIAACVVSFIFFVWITRKRRSLRSRALLLSLLALVISAVVVFAAWDRIEDRFEGAGYIDRATVWKDSLGILRDYPLFGSGLGAFESTYLRYQSRYNQALFDHAHNDYIEVMTDTGVIGTALAGGAALLLFSSLYRRWRTKRSTYAQCIGAGGLSASVALAVHSFTDFNLHIPANAPLFTVIVAITYVAVYNLSDSRSSVYLTSDPGESGRGSHGLPISRYAFRITILLLGTLRLYFPSTSFMADYHYGQIGRILDDPATDYLDLKPLLPASLPDYLAALHAAEKAQALEPTRALYAATVAEQYTRLGRWAAALKLPDTPLPAGVPERDHSFRQAERYLQSAIGLEPTNPDYHLALADIYEVYRKDPVKVDTELKLAAAAFPFNGAVRNAVAMHYLLADQKYEALEQARLLAKNDDSYLLNESPQKAYTLERMPQ
jgi:O-Antigen ligase